MHTQVPLSEQCRPQRAAAQMGDAKRKLAIDSSSESGNESDASFGGSRDDRKQSSVVRRRSSIGKVSHVTTITKRSSQSHTTPRQNESLPHSVHLTPAKRLRTSSNTSSSSSLSSVPSDFEYGSLKRPKIQSSGPDFAGRVEHIGDSFELPLPLSLAPLLPVSGSPQPKARRRSEPVQPVLTSSFGQEPSSSQTRTTSSGILPVTTSRVQTAEWCLDDVIQPYRDVFVKLTSIPGSNSRISDVGVMWWPATVTSKSHEVSAPLGTEIHILPITSPNPNIILPLLDPTTGQPRFKLSDYYSETTGHGDLERNKLWSQAMKDIAGEESDDDSLIDISGHPQSSSGEVVIDEKPRLKRQLAEMQCEEARQLIGQRVLSLVKEGHRYYWPGTIKDVFLRERVGTAVQYKVEFWDGKITNVPRQCLLTPDDPEFFTCQMGPRQAYGRVGNEYDLFRVPESVDNFGALSLRAQLACVRPILLAIIRDDYPPARGFVDLFYDGHDMTKVQRYGGMDPGEITEGIRAMLLGGPAYDAVATESQTGERFDSAGFESEPPSSGTVAPSEVGSDADTTATAEDTQTPRPQGSFQDVAARSTGSQRYEELPDIGRLMFCTDVLTTQAALQLVLWRTGTRTQPDLRSPEEELALYDKGNVLLDDWASDSDVYACIERLRKDRQAFLGVNTDGDHGTLELIGGTSTRPKWKKV